MYVSLRELKNYPGISSAGSDQVHEPLEGTTQPEEVRIGIFSLFSVELTLELPLSLLASLWIDRSALNFYSL